MTTTAEQIRDNLIAEYGKVTDEGRAYRSPAPWSSALPQGYSDPKALAECIGNALVTAPPGDHRHNQLYNQGLTDLILDITAGGAVCLGRSFGDPNDPNIPDEIRILDSVNQQTSIMCQNAVRGSLVKTMYRLAVGQDESCLAKYSSSMAMDKGGQTALGMTLLNTAAGGMLVNVESSSPMYFATNNTTRLTIDATGGVTLASISALSSAATAFLVGDSGTIKSRTAGQVLGDIGAAAAGSLVQHALDSTTAHTIGSLTSTYLPYILTNKLVDSPIHTDGTGTEINGNLQMLGIAATGGISFFGTGLTELRNHIGRIAETTDDLCFYYRPSSPWLTAMRIINVTGAINLGSVTNGSTPSGGGFLSIAGAGFGDIQYRSPSQVLGDIGGATSAQGGHADTAYGWGNWASHFGSTTGTICQGDDGRLGDARTPTQHALDSTTLHSIGSLTSGYVPYILTNKLVNSPIQTDGTGIGVGVAPTENTIVNLQKEQNTHTAMALKNTTVGSGARVILGTQSDVADLNFQVNSSIFTGEAGRAILKSWSNTGGFWLQNCANTDMTFQTNDIARMTIAAAGGVGIGCFPLTRLHLTETTATTNAPVHPLRLTEMCSGSTATGFGVGIEFELTAKSGYEGIAAAIAAFWSSYTGGHSGIRLTGRHAATANITICNFSMNSATMRIMTCESDGDHLFEWYATGGLQAAYWGAGVGSIVVSGTYLIIDGTNLPDSAHASTGQLYVDANGFVKRQA